MNADQLKDMQEVVEDAKANALRFPEISLDDLEALVKLGFECLRLREQQRWIPVSERLPEQGHEVLAFTSHGNSFVGFLGIHGKWLVGCGIHPFFDDRDDLYFDGEVTRWMPLPEATAGEQA